MKFTADIEVMEYNSREEIEAEIARYTAALEQKAAWDALTEDQKEAEFERRGHGLN